MRRYLRVVTASPVGASDKETYFLASCNWSRVMFKGFRDCVTGKTLDGLLEMTRGDSDKETYFLASCNWFLVMFKGFRDCVTGKTPDGLLEMTRGDSVVVTLGGVTEPILNMTSVVLLDNTTDAARAGLVEVALEEIVNVEDFPGVVSLVPGGMT